MMQTQLSFLNNVSDTSCKALAEITFDGSRSTKRRKVLLAIMMSPGLSRAEIADICGLRLSSVCGRVAELIADGQVVENGTKLDGVTHKTVARLCVAA
jgi:predicted transcriptional regulator